jgi:hypothetical protein
VHFWSARRKIAFFGATIKFFEGKIKKTGPKKPA